MSYVGTEALYIGTALLVLPLLLVLTGPPRFITRVFRSVIGMFRFVLRIARRVLRRVLPLAVPLSLCLAAIQLSAHGDPAAGFFLATATFTGTVFIGGFFIWRSLPHRY